MLTLSKHMQHLPVILWAHYFFSVYSFPRKLLLPHQEYCSCFSLVLLIDRVWICQFWWLSAFIFALKFFYFAILFLSALFLWLSFVFWSFFLLSVLLYQPLRLPFFLSILPFINQNSKFLDQNHSEKHWMMKSNRPMFCGHLKNVVLQLNFPFIYQFWYSLLMWKIGHFYAFFFTQLK